MLILYSMVDATCTVNLEEQCARVTVISMVESVPHSVIIEMAYTPANRRHVVKSTPGRMCHCMLSRYNCNHEMLVLCKLGKRNDYVHILLYAKSNHLWNLSHVTKFRYWSNCILIYHVCMPNQAV